MSDAGEGKGWSTGKILAVVIPICLVVVAVAVTLILVLGKDDTEEKKGGEEGTITEEEMIDTYEQIKQDAEAAVSQMEDLESGEATSDPAAYEQQLEEAQAAFELLYADLDEFASLAVEVTEGYEELNAYIYDYYEYLYELTGQAINEIEYLMSLVPTFEDLQQFEEIIGRLENLPAGGQFGELSSQLSQKAQQALSGLEGKQIPEGMSGYGVELDSLTTELNSLAQQMSQALSSGNAAAFSSYADQAGAAITQAQQQLSSSINSLVSGYASMLSQLEAAIQSALP
jgi:hypothetical protein